MGTSIKLFNYLLLNSLVQFVKEIYKIPRYKENIESILQIALKILRINLDNLSKEQALILGVKPGKCTISDILHGIY